MNDTPHFDGQTIEDRTCDFETWVREVRDPAVAAAKRIRRLVSRNQKAMAQYQVAQVETDRWAIRVRCEYSCGDFEGRGSPWEVFSCRDECVEEFFDAAKAFFSSPKSFRIQEEACIQMLKLFEQQGGLFGLIDPPEVIES